jgi:acetyl esterase/lipase
LREGFTLILVILRRNFLAVLDRVDPEYLPVIRAVPIIDLSDIIAAREALHVVFALGGVVEPHSNVEREDKVISGLAGNPDIKVRLFRPIGAAAPLPALVWIQGGGYVLTAADPDDEWCQDMAANLGCLVVSVFWRRAPEHPFPAAHNDCYGALRWVIDNVNQLGVDRDRIAVGGASSGGGAAASVALHARDDGLPLAHQILIYPMLDDRNTSQSSHEVTDPELWNRASNILAWKAYLGSDYGTENVSPYAAPARAGELAMLAPATILTAELDLFRDENFEYANRLLLAGVPTEFHMYPSVHHGFDRHNPQGKQAKRMLADRDAALARAFTKT